MAERDDTTDAPRRDAESAELDSADATVSAREDVHPTGEKQAAENVENESQS